MKKIIVLLLPLMLMGCTITPGSHINIPANTNQFNDGKMTINVIQIDDDLVRQQKASNGSNSPEPTISTISNQEMPAYTIGIGDVVTVVVWEHPELTSPLGQFRSSDEQGNIVYEDGTIFYPYAGSVLVKGKTVSQVREIITQRLTKYIENPQVDVRVAAYKSQKYIVSGDVQNPGVYPINNVPQRILDALNLAGGLNPQGNINAVTLARGEHQHVIPIYDLLYNGNTKHNVLLQDGDVLHVQENTNRNVFVMGEVVRPQTLALSDLPLSLTQALSSAGGINELRADANGIYVVRVGEQADKVDVYQISLQQAYHYALADQFTLNERDIVYVSAAPITRWNRFISNILPSITSIRTLDDIGGTN